MWVVMRKASGMRKESASVLVDRWISALAARQHGVVATRQLRAFGLTDRGVAHRVANGKLHRVHRGVYAVGHPVLTPHGRWMAGVLAGGPGAVLSHAAAAALWGLRPSAAVIVDVTVPGTGSRKRQGLRIHRARTLETTTYERVPVTTPERTILDLAATLQRRPLERLLDQAENTRLTDVPSLEALARAHTGHRGAPKLLAALDTHTPSTTRTRSGLEERFLAICRRHGLPQPRVNHYVEGRERDFVFPGQRLVIEIDSFTHHRSRRAFEDDRYRDATLLQAGYRTLRITDTQVEYAPDEVAATLQAILRPADAPTAAAAAR
jgi:very-short-patch-repair endonuclease